MSEEIRQAIRELAGTTQFRPHSITGKVLQVNKKELTIDVQPSEGSPEFFNVRLRAVSDQKYKGLYCIPKKGSEVVVTLLDAHTGYAALCAEIEKQVCLIDETEQTLEANKLQIKHGEKSNFEHTDTGFTLAVGEGKQTLQADKLQIKYGDSSFEQTREGFMLNGGKLGGLVKIQELVKRMNAIEDKLNNLISSVKTHTHPPIPLAPAGAAPVLPSLNLSALTPLLEKTQQGKLEDEKVKH